MQRYITVTLDEVMEYTKLFIDQNGRDNPIPIRNFLALAPENVEQAIGYLADYDLDRVPEIIEGFIQMLDVYEFQPQKNKQIMVYKTRTLN